MSGDKNTKSNSFNKCEKHKTTEYISIMHKYNMHSPDIYQWN